MLGGPVGKWVRARTPAAAQELSDEYQRSANLAPRWSRRQTLLWLALLVFVLVAGGLIGVLT